jgi:hypothetical protein
MLHFRYLAWSLARAMATTDRGSAPIMPTDSTGTMLIGALTITGTKLSPLAITAALH